MKHARNLGTGLDCKAAFFLLVLTISVSPIGPYNPPNVVDFLYSNEIRSCIYVCVGIPKEHRAVRIPPLLLMTSLAWAV